MLLLTSRIKPTDIGASSLEKLRMTCCFLFSRISKLLRSSPTTVRFIRSVTVTGTRTRSTLDRKEGFPKIAVLIDFVAIDGAEDGVMCTGAGSTCAADFEEKVTTMKATMRS